MARGYGRRRGGPMPVKLIAILAGMAVVALVIAVFWFSGQAASHKPPQTEMRVEATNVGPH
jgi:hypothetical protein